MTIASFGAGGCNEQRDETSEGGIGPGGPTSGIGDDTTAAGDDNDDSVKLDIGAGEGEGNGEGGGICPTITGDAILSGTVYAPNGVIPVSGALVYASKDAPDPIPQTVYCAECVELDCESPFALTEPDGSFSFDLPPGSRYLVVQKGQFMRVTEIEVEAGETVLDSELTTLPDHNDPPNGLFIPSIALAWGAHDRLEDALGKLGLADTMIEGYSERFVPGTETFDVWTNSNPLSNSPTTTSNGGFAQLLSSYPLLEKYHIIFVPCSDDTALSALDDPAVVENVRKWVQAGGKFYVSDWSNEFVERVFPGYQEFYTSGGSADLSPPYDSVGTVLDPDLTAWLEALPEGLKDINPLNGPDAGFPVVDNPPQIETVENWSGIQSTPDIFVDDGMGGMVDVGHKVWIEGPGDGAAVPTGNHPLTVTGQYGCGKLLFTTYHMAEFDQSYVGLTPQELVLLYLILEIGVCQTPFDPPPPQG